MNLQNIYVQNLVTDYLDKCSADNKQWKQIALKYSEHRKQEFNNIKPTGKIPVLLTSELLYDVLLNEDQIRYSARDIYHLKTTIPIPAGNNKLHRPLIPLYRHYRYRIANNEHEEYRNSLKELFLQSSY